MVQSFGQPLFGCLIGMAAGSIPILDIRYHSEAPNNPKRPAPTLVFINCIQSVTGWAAVFVFGRFRPSEKFKPTAAIGADRFGFVHWAAIIADPEGDMAKLAALDLTAQIVSEAKGTVINAPPADGAKILGFHEEHPFVEGS